MNNTHKRKENFETEIEQQQMVASQAVLKMRKGSLRDRHMRTIQVDDEDHAFKIIK